MTITVPSVLVMAGGKGTRMGLAEKYMMNAGGTPLVERILQAACMLSRAIYVCTSGQIPQLERLASTYGASIIYGAGRSYYEDLSRSYIRVKEYPLLVIPGDLAIPDEQVLTSFLSRAVELECDLVNLSAGGNITGICLIRHRPMDAKELSYDAIDFPQDAVVNVNTASDFERAEKLFEERAGKQYDY